MLYETVDRPSVSSIAAVGLLLSTPRVECAQQQRRAVLTAEGQGRTRDLLRTVPGCDYVSLYQHSTGGCESWTLRKNEEACLDAVEMKGLRKVLRLSWTAKKTNEWVLNKAGVKKELLDTVKARKLAYWSHHEETRELPALA